MSTTKDGLHTVQNAPGFAMVSLATSSESATVVSRSPNATHSRPQLGPRPRPLSTLRHTRNRAGGLRRVPTARHRSHTRSGLRNRRAAKRRVRSRRPRRRPRWVAGRRPEDRASNIPSRRNTAAGLSQRPQESLHIQSRPLSPPHPSQPEYLTWSRRRFSSRPPHPRLPTNPWYRWPPPPPPHPAVASAGPLLRTYSTTVTTFRHRPARKRRGARARRERTGEGQERLLRSHHSKRRRHQTDPDTGREDRWSRNLVELG